MKKILKVVISLVTLCCKNNTVKKNSSLIGEKFMKISEVKNLTGFKKVSDTSFYDDKYSILHLQNEKENIILFNNIKNDLNKNREYNILDTLIIPKLKKSEFITIGYCQINSEDNENLIAVVRKSNEFKIKGAINAWIANKTSNKIEKVKMINQVNCFNEFYLD